MASPESHRRFTRGLAYQLLSSIAQSAVAVLLMPIVVKQAGPAPLGAYLILNSIITLMTTFCTLGAGFQCRRSLPGTLEPGARGRLFGPSASFQLLTAAFCAVLLSIGLPLLDTHVFHGDVALRTSTIWLAVFALWTNTLADDYFRYTHQIPVIARAIMVRALLHPGLVIGASLGGASLSADLLIRLQATAYLLVAVPLWWRIGREIPLRFSLADSATRRTDISLGFPLITAVIIENLLAVSDRYILAAWFSPREVGAYASACTIGALVLLLPRITNNALLPALSQAVDEGRPDEARKLLGSFLQVFTILALPFAAGGLMLGHPLLVWLASEEVAALAHWVVPLAAISGMFNGYSYLMFNALFIDRRTGVWFKANVIAAAVAILLSVLLVGWLRRIEAAAVASIAGYAVSFLIIRRAGVWQLPLDRDALTKSVAATLAMVGTLAGLRLFAFFQVADSIRILLQVAAGGTVYFAALAALGGWTPRRFLAALRP
jgi:O-antigen/teichoic acid export membrane protein